MGHSQAGKAENRARILDEAARQVRRDGLEAVSVGALMKSVGLTHGGFYGHFESRSALLAEALGRALEEGRARSQAHFPDGPPDLVARVSAYLSPSHRDARETGCAMAALLSDVGRADEGARSVMQDYVESLIQRLTAELGGDEARAMMVVSAMIGGLALSRVFTDERRADALLEAVRDSLLALDQPATTLD
ncbi:TetR/AcrR family transcriptional regulator [soil metagenome]